MRWTQHRYEHTTTLTQTHTNSIHALFYCFWANLCFIKRVKSRQPAADTSTVTSQGLGNTFKDCVYECGCVLTVLGINPWHSQCMQLFSNSLTNLDKSKKAELIIKNMPQNEQKSIKHCYSLQSETVLLHRG